MTSTNDGKDVKSNQTSGPKGKSYYIELYKSLEASLSSDCELRERTQHLCEAWRRIHSLCQHSAPSTHPHLLTWLQRHTSKLVLQTEWQSKECKEQHESLEEAINDFIKECENRSGGSRDAGPPPWETQLVARGEWFKKILENPWGHPVLRILLDPRQEQPSDEEVLEWLKEERGVMFMTRLRQLTASASKCDDLALALSSAVMDRVRACAAPPADSETEPADVKDKPKADKKPTFEDILKTEAGFTVDVWELLIDMEFVLLHKRDKRSRCIELAKQTPLRNGYQLVERLQSRLETSPREKKLWKNAKEVATLIAQVIITRCMVVPVCSGAPRTALYCCARSLVRALGPRLPPAARALAAPAATARHLHTLAAAVDAQCSQSKEDMKPFVCELYVRAITAGMNELERLKLKTEKEAEARLAEQTLASWFTQLGVILSASERLRCECTLTAFSVHPTPAMYERIKTAPVLPPLKLDDNEIKEEPNKEFGSWASDSRGQTNFVKTSETLNLKHTQHQANVLSTAIFSEGEALGISPELCTDIAVLLSGPRLKTLSWDTDRELLLENCRTYMERTNFGTRALTTELKYLNLDPREFQHLPEEEDDESDMYYGIEKGYEHLVQEYQEPEEIWQDAEDPERTESANSSGMESETPVRSKKSQKKAKKVPSSEDDSDPLSLVAEAKRVEKKKERPHSKERSKEPKKSKSKAKPKDPLEIKDQSTEEKKKKEPKKKREKKKKEKVEPPPKSSLSSLIGMRVANEMKKPDPPAARTAPSVSDASDYDSQGKSSINSILSEHNETDVLYDGLFSMDEIKSPEKSINPDKNMLTKNTELHVTNGKVGVSKPKTHHNASPSRTDAVKHQAPNSPHSRTCSPSSMLVKESLTKLLNYRRQKALENEQRINLQPNVLHTFSSNSSSDTPTITPAPSPMPGTPISSPGLTVNMPESPKVYMNKSQSEQLSELKNEVNNLLSNKTFGIARPVIQYSPKSNNSLLNNSQTSGARFQSPPLQSTSSQKSMQEIKIPQTQVKTPSLVGTVPLRAKPGDSASQQNFHKFLKELQESINAGAGSHANKNIKKEIKPVSRVTPVVPTAKAEPNTSPQCAKQSQKKSSEFLNTFSRLSYLHKNKVDPKGNGTKPVVEALIEYQSKALQNPPTDVEINRIVMEQKLAKVNFIQTTNDSVKPSASKSDVRAAHQHPENSQSVLKKLDKSVSNTIKHGSYSAKQNPVIANILSSQFTKPLAKPENVYKNKNLQIERQPETSANKVSSLTERDQQDLLALLRQQTKLNHRPKVENVQEKVQPPQTITGHLPPTNYPVPCTSQSPSKHKILDAPNITYSNMNNKQLTKPSPSIKPSNVNLDLRMPQTKPLNMVKTELNCTKTIDTKPTKKIEILSNIEIKSSVKHKSETGPKPKEDTDWEKVMDAILSHKTPSRGPKALDMALNKEVYNKKLAESLRNQRIVKASSTGDLIKMTNVISKGQSKPVLTAEPEKSPQPTILKRSNTESVIKTIKKSLKTPSKATNSSTNPNISRPSQPETPKRQIQTEKRPSHVIKDQIDVLKKAPLKPHEKQFTASYYKEEDPFISGIPNSDYDLLEELMDDDLRQEIGELSSDEDNYRGPMQGPKDKNYSISKHTSAEEKCLNPTLPNTTITAHKKPVPKARNDIPKTAFDSSAHTQHTPALCNTKSVIKTAAYVNHEAKNVQPTIAIHQMPCTVIESPKNRNNQSYHANSDQMRTVDQTHTFVTTVPQQTALKNVVLIGSDIVYQPCTVQTPVIATNIVQNTYLTYNNQQNMALYQTTQFAAPVVNPLIIGNAITVSKTTVSSKEDVKNEAIQQKTVIHDAKDSKSESKTSPSEDPNDDTTTKIEKEKIDINSNKNVCERKVLSEVQEKQKTTTEKIEPKNTRSQARKSFERDLMNEVIKDQERLQKKRMSILNRNICHRSDKKAIPLSYAPLKPLKIILKIPKMHQRKHEHASARNGIKNQSGTTKALEESLETKVTPTNNNTNSKENKDKPSTCRRILLRSSNKDLKLNTEVTEKVSVPRKTKVRLKPIPTESAMKILEKCTDTDSLNKLVVVKKPVTKKTLNKKIKKVEVKKKATKIQPKRTVKVIKINPKRQEVIPNEMTDLIDIEDEIITSKILGVMSPDQPIPPLQEIPNVEEILGDIEENRTGESKNDNCPSPSILDTDDTLNQLLVIANIDKPNNNGAVFTEENKNKSNDIVLNKENDATSRITETTVVKDTAKKNDTNTDIVDEIESYVKKLEDNLKDTASNQRLDFECNEIMFSSGEVTDNSISQPDKNTTEVVTSVTPAKQNTTDAKISNSKAKNQEKSLPIEKGHNKIMSSGAISDSTPTRPKRKGADLITPVNSAKPSTTDAKINSTAKNQEKATPTIPERKTAVVITRVNSSKLNSNDAKINSEDKNQEKALPIEEEHNKIMRSRAVTDSMLSLPERKTSEIITPVNTAKQNNTDAKINSNAKNQEKALHIQEEVICLDEDDEEPINDKNKEQRKEPLKQNSVHMNEGKTDTREKRKDKTNVAFPQSQLDAITVEELPGISADPMKRCVRIKLPDGKLFKATIHGHMNVDVNTLFSDPLLKSKMLSNMSVRGGRYTLNICVPPKPAMSNSSMSKPENLESRIQGITIKHTLAPVETIDLLSDSDEETHHQSFKTEFGKYQVQTMSKNLLKDHQKLFDKKCVVKLKRADLQKYLNISKEDAIESAAENHPTNQKTISLQKNKLLKDQEETAVQCTVQHVASVIQPTVQPMVKSGLVPITQHDIQTHIEPMIQSATQPIFELDAQPITQSDGPSNTHFEDQPKIQPVQTDEQPINQPEKQPVDQSVDKPEIQSELQPVIQSDVQPIVESELQPIAEPEIQPTVESEIQPTVECEIQSDSQIEPGVQSISQPAVEPITETDLQAVTQPIIEPEQLVNKIDEQIDAQPDIQPLIQSEEHTSRSDVDTILPDEMPAVEVEIPYDQQTSEPISDVDIRSSLIQRKVVEVIEIDDSSNDEVDIGKSAEENTIVGLIPNLEQLNVPLILKRAEIFNPPLKARPVPVEAKINQFKNLLFKDLGLEDLAENLTQCDESSLSFAGPPIVTDSGNSASNDGEQKIPALPDCFVKLTKCDDLVRKYENLKLLKQCFIKLVRCDELVEKANDEVAEQSDELIDIDIQDDIFEDTLLDVAPLSRCGSFSILDNCDIIDVLQTVDQFERSNSPVMEAYETIASLCSRKATVEQEATCERSTEINKPNICDNLVPKQNTVMPLKALVLKLFHNPSLIDQINAARLKTKRHLRSFTLNRKRKSFETFVTNNSKIAKINEDTSKYLELDEISGKTIELNKDCVIAHEKLIEVAQDFSSASCDNSVLEVDSRTSCLDPSEDEISASVLRQVDLIQTEFYIDNEEPQFLALDVPKHTEVDTENLEEDTISDVGNISLDSNETNVSMDTDTISKLDTEDIPKEDDEDTFITTELTNDSKINGEILSQEIAKITKDVASHEVRLETESIHMKDCENVDENKDTKLKESGATLEICSENTQMDATEMIMTDMSGEAETEVKEMESTVINLRDDVETKQNETEVVMEDTNGEVEKPQGDSNTRTENICESVDANLTDIQIKTDKNLEKSQTVMDNMFDTSDDPEIICENIDALVVTETEKEAEPKLESENVLQSIYSDTVRKFDPEKSKENIGSDSEIRITEVEIETDKNACNDDTSTAGAEISTDTVTQTGDTEIHSTEKDTYSSLEQPDKTVKNINEEADAILVITDTGKETDVKSHDPEIAMKGIHSKTENNLSESDISTENVCKTIKTETMVVEREAVTNIIEPEIAENICDNSDTIMSKSEMTTKDKCADTYAELVETDIDKESDTTLNENICDEDNTSIETTDEIDEPDKNLKERQIDNNGTADKKFTEPEMALVDTKMEKEPLISRDEPKVVIESTSREPESKMLTEICVEANTNMQTTEIVAEADMNLREPQIVQNFLNNSDTTTAAPEVTTEVVCEAPGAVSVCDEVEKTVDSPEVAMENTIPDESEMPIMETTETVEADINLEASLIVENIINNSHPTTVEPEVTTEGIFEAPGAVLLYNEVETTEAVPEVAIVNTVSADSEMPLEIYDKASNSMASTKIVDEADINLEEPQIVEDIINSSDTTMVEPEVITESICEAPGAVLLYNEVETTVDVPEVAMENTVSADSEMPLEIYDKASNSMASTKIVDEADINLEEPQIVEDIINSSDTIMVEPEVITEVICEAPGAVLHYSEVETSVDVLEMAMENTIPADSDLPTEICDKASTSMASTEIDEADINIEEPQIVEDISSSDTTMVEPEVITEVICEIPNAVLHNTEVKTIQDAPEVVMEDTILVEAQMSMKNGDGANNGDGETTEIVDKTDTNLEEQEVVASNNADKLLLLATENNYECADAVLVDTEKGSETTFDKPEIVIECTQLTKSQLPLEKASHVVDTNMDTAIVDDADNNLDEQKIVDIVTSNNVDTTTAELEMTTENIFGDNDAVLVNPVIEKESKTILCEIEMIMKGTQSVGLEIPTETACAVTDTIIETKIGEADKNIGEQEIVGCTNTCITTESEIMIENICEDTDSILDPENESEETLDDPEVVMKGIQFTKLEIPADDVCEFAETNIETIEIEDDADKNIDEHDVVSSTSAGITTAESEMSVENDSVLADTEIGTTLGDSEIVKESARSETESGTPSKNVCDVADTNMETAIVDEADNDLDDQEIVEIVTSNNADTTTTEPEMATESICGDTDVVLVNTVIEKESHTTQKDAQVVTDRTKLTSAMVNKDDSNQEPEIVVEVVCTYADEKLVLPVIEKEVKLKDPVINMEDICDNAITTTENACVDASPKLVETYIEIETSRDEPEIVVEVNCQYADEKLVLPVIEEDVNLKLKEHKTVSEVTCKTTKIQLEELEIALQSNSEDIYTENDNSQEAIEPNTQIEEIVIEDSCDDTDTLLESEVVLENRFECADKMKDTEIEKESEKKEHNVEKETNIEPEEAEKATKSICECVDNKQVVSEKETLSNKCDESRVNLLENNDDEIDRKFKEIETTLKSMFEETDSMLDETEIAIENATKVPEAELDEIVSVLNNKSARTDETIGKLVTIECEEDIDFDVNKIDDKYIVEEIVDMRSDEILDEEMTRKILANAMSQVNDSPINEIMLHVNEETNESETQEYGGFKTLENNVLVDSQSSSIFMDCDYENSAEETILITQQIGEDGRIEEIDIKLNVPRITYSKKYPSGLILDDKKKRKRKMNMTDVKVYSKKYRKGKNIDYPKIAVTTMGESAYTKEFKQLMDYCSTVKFSYSRPFHKEYIDVQKILQSWPIKGICNVEQSDTENDDTLFTDIENEVNTIHDPSIQTLAEEINSNIESDYKSSDIIETNFNMGFGERSGRVIQNLEDGCGIKFSAATLSDVKQTQPLLLSENYGNCKRVHTTINFTNNYEIEKLKSHFRCIQMKEKVRSFFKKTMTELRYDLTKQQGKDKINFNSLFDSTDFLHGLTNPDFIQPAPFEAIVQVVQVGQLPVSAAAQNPVTCDPRVTQVSNVSPSQCSAENSPGDDQSVIKTEYTELTTADLTMPLAQEYVQHIQSMPMPPHGHEILNYPMGSNYTVDVDIKPEIKIEMEETPEIKEEMNDNYDNGEYQPFEKNMNSVDYSHITPLEPNSNVTMVYNYTEKHSVPEAYQHQKDQEHLQIQQQLHQQQQQEQYQQQQEQEQYHQHQHETYAQQQKLIQQQIEQEQHQLEQQQLEQQQLEQQQLEKQQLEQQQLEQQKLEQQKLEQQQLEQQQLEQQRLEQQQFQQQQEYQQRQIEQQQEQEKQKIMELQQLQIKQQQQEEQKQQQLRLQELKQQQELKEQREQEEEMQRHQQRLLELKRAQDLKQQQQQLQQELKQQKQQELRQQQQKQKELKQQQQQELKQQKQQELKQKQQKQQELKQQQQELKQQQQAQLKQQKQQQQELKQQQLKQQKQQLLQQKQQMQQQQELQQKQQLQQQQELQQKQQQQELQQKQQAQLQQELQQKQQLQQQQELQQKQQMQQQQELQQKQQMQQQHELQQKQQQQELQQQQQQNGSHEKSDQIAHAMNAAGISSTTDNRTQALVNMITQKLRQGNVTTGQSSNNFQKTTSINAMSLQQALAQILPPPLNQTNGSENNQQTANTHTPQVLHIVQGKSASGNHQQITLVDNTQQSVINAPNSTPVLHIVQNKTVPPGPASNGTPQQANSFSGLSLVDGGLQQGNQLLHIVNAGNQKNANTGQLLKRVNLLTNLTNAQGGNEQKMVQFVCKSADGKSIQLNGPHQRSMVLRLQPVETPNLQPTQPKQIDTQDMSPTHNSNSKDAEIKSRSIYEENYAKFIQSSSPKTPGSEKGTSLPKFNQAFGKQVYQDGGQKEISNGNEMSPNDESPDCQANDNAMNLDHITQIGSPPLLLRKPATSQAQPNLVQQIKQTVSPMNLHGGVIYTRQIPVNLAGGQTINLITVPSSDLSEDANQKPQGEIEPSIIKIVPQTPTHSNTDGSEENNTHMGTSNENTHTPQPQPVLTQMRIKLPMLSKAPQMVSGGRVVRPSFFQIQRNVISGTNQPVYQQLVLTAAPQLGQQTIRLPAQTPQTSSSTTSRPAAVKVTPSESQSSTESMSSSTLEQLREFDLVLEQVKERSTVQPPKSKSKKKKDKTGASVPATETAASTSSASAEPSRSTPAPHKQHQVLYSIGNTQPLNVAYVNRKGAATPSPASTSTSTTSTFVRSPDSSGIVDSSPSSSSQIPHTVTSEPSTSSDAPAQSKKSSSKSKSRPKASSNPPNTLKLNTTPPKPSTQKPAEDEQTTQRILYILAEYKEQVENSPDKDKPAPRRRTNPPSNPGSSKRKKHRRNRDLSPTDDSCRTMGSEDSSCGTSQGDCNESCIDSHSPQDSPRKVARKLTFENDTSAQSAPPTPQPRPQPQQRNVIVADGQTITVARGTAGKPSTAVLMPANYILPVSMIKGGQQIAIVTNRGPKLLTVGGGEGGATNALLLQRLIGPAGLKPVLTRPGVRHVRLPTAALHNLQAFNLATATTVQPPDSTASPAPAPTPPELIETRANSSPWRTESREEVKPERGSSPEGEPWHLPATANPHDYSYEEVVRTDNMDRTVLDPIPDRYSPDMEAQRIFDKMFDVDSKRSYMVGSHDDSPRCGYDIDASDCDDKGYHQVVQKKEGSHHRQHRLTHVSAAALRHKYAILEHELRLQKSLSEECEDLGVDSPSASELFPEAELLFAASPAHDHTQDHGHHSHTPQPLLHHTIPQPDLDDQIATDQLLQRSDMHDDRDLGIGLEDVGIVTVSEDGMQATIALDQEEFARAHPNTTFHSEPTDEGEVQPFTLSGLKGRHITSTIFHANRAPGTVLMTAPQTTVISQATAESSGVQNTVKYADIDNMINSLPGPHTHNNINLSSVLVKDDGLTRFDSILNDNRELHLSNTASHIVHATGNNTTQVIRRVCYGNKREQTSRFLMDESDIMASHHAKMMDDSRDFGDVDDDSSPERTELFWESNSASERETRRPLDFSSDSDKCCKSPSFEENNSTDSSGLGAHMRLDSVIKDARGIERRASADGSSADDNHAPPLRTYPPKRMYHALDAQRSLSGKTRAPDVVERHEVRDIPERHHIPERHDSGEGRRRASGRGVVKRGCHCCNGEPAPPRPKKPRQRKPNLDFTNN